MGPTGSRGHLQGMRWTGAGGVGFEDFGGYSGPPRRRGRRGRVSRVSILLMLWLMIQAWGSISARREVGLEGGGFVHGGGLRQGDEEHAGKSRIARRGRRRAMDSEGLGGAALPPEFAVICLRGIEGGGVWCPVGAVS